MVKKIVTALSLMALFEIGCKPRSTSEVAGLGTLKDASESGLLVAKQVKEECSCMLVTYNVDPTVVNQKDNAVFLDRKKRCALFAAEKLLINKSDKYIETSYNFDGRYVFVESHGEVSGNDRTAIYDTKQKRLGCVYIGEAKTPPNWMNSL